MSYIQFNVLIKKLLTGFFLATVFFIQNSFAQEPSNIIINNEATSTNQNVITAPALIPSQSDQMRTLRQKQEVETEDSILKELERQRILDERKRFHKIFNKNEEPQEKPPAYSSTPAQPYWFGEKSFLSLGAGLTNYHNVTNINSTEIPSFLGSFGGYGYKGQLIFDATFFYSVHYLKTPNRNYQNVREKLKEPGLAMAVK